MKSLGCYEKLFITLALCTVLINSSAAKSSDEMDDKLFTRNKRFNSRCLALWGTNWCLDAITDPESSTGTGLFFQTDECCKKHVKCTSEEKENLLDLYPTKEDEIKDEIFRSCVCDEEFAQCLKNVEGIRFKARKVGRYYFNTLATECRDVELKKVDNLQFSMSD